MYFWDVSKLKSQLSESGLNEHQAFLYLLLFLGLSTAALSFGVENPNVWDRVDSVTGLVSLVAGTTYVYRANGGGMGSDFLSRYIALSWVMMIRIVVLFGLPLVIMVILVEEMVVGSVADHSTAPQSMAILMIEVAFYLRLAHHIRDITRGTSETGARGA